jgi:hypothetical protein
MDDFELDDEALAQLDAVEEEFMQAQPVAHLADDDGDVKPVLPPPSPVKSLGASGEAALAEDVEAVASDKRELEEGDEEQSEAKRVKLEVQPEARGSIRSLRGT